MHERLRRAHVNRALQRYQLVLPSEEFPVYHDTPSGRQYTLDEPLKRVLSEFIRRSRISLVEFVELFRHQTIDDYRPNKCMVVSVIQQLCSDYERLETLLDIVNGGIKVSLTQEEFAQHARPKNHGSCAPRLNLLRKNIRKEQDANRCIVVDLDILDLWPEIVISPFGVVPKAGADPDTSGRTIIDLSFPEGKSVNDLTDKRSVPPPDYQLPAAIAVEILRVKKQAGALPVKIAAGDVASAFRHASLHSSSVRLFGGRVPEDNALIIELSAPFGWTGSPGFYEVLGGAISHVHGATGNAQNPRGFFSYHWVDDHVMVGADEGSNLAECQRSLRCAMLQLAGPHAANEDKFTEWSTSLKVLGLVFDTVNDTVAMPPDKILKARGLVADAFHSTTLSRTAYRSLLGSLRHVATCVRPARPFIQRLSRRERHLHRFQLVSVDEEMRQDLLWWWSILHAEHLNGVPLAHFGSLPAPDVVVGMDACDTGLCAFDKQATSYILYQFTTEEAQLITDFKNGADNHFDINYRELLSVAFAVSAWGPRWSNPTAPLPVHVQFQIDNTSAVAWNNKLCSRNPRAQDVIRLLGHWEVQFGLRFSAIHIPGVHNTIADAGSRSFTSPAHRALFSSLTSSWSQVAPAMTPGNVSTLWRTITDSSPLPRPPSPRTTRP